MTAGLATMRKLFIVMLVILVASLGCEGRQKRRRNRGQGRQQSGCEHAANKMLCLPQSYSKFELPFRDSVNVVEIGIDISDVLRINDKVQ